MTYQEIIEELEEITIKRPDLLIRLKGIVKKNEKYELLIYRGFSSSTTHQTSHNPYISVIPKDTELKSAELLEGPLNPSGEKILAGPMSLENLLQLETW